MLHAAPDAKLSTDNELLAGYRQGDPEALRVIYERFAGTLARRCRRWRPRYECGMDVDDLVHETFSRAFSHRVRQAFDVSRPLLPYLLTVLKTTCLDAARSFKRSSCVSVQGQSEASALEGGNIEVDLLAVRSVRAFLGSQSCQIREVYQERFVEERSQRAAARVMGLSHQRLRTLESALIRSAAKNLALETNTRSSVDRTQ